MKFVHIKPHIQDFRRVNRMPHQGHTGQSEARRKAGKAQQQQRSSLRRSHTCRLPIKRIDNNNLTYKRIEYVSRLKFIKHKKMPSDASGPQRSGRAGVHLSGHLLEKFKLALLWLCLQLNHCCLGDNVIQTIVKPKDDVKPKMRRAPKRPQFPGDTQTVKWRLLKIFLVPPANPSRKCHQNTFSFMYQFHSYGVKRN